MYGTLESPFDPAYLEEVIAQAGFTDVRRFVEVDELVEIGDVGGMFNRMREHLSYRVGRRAPETNILIATKPLGDGAGAGFAAEITADGSWHLDAHGAPARAPGAGSATRATRSGRRARSGTAWSRSART